MLPLSKKDFIYLFLEMGEGKEEKMERNINVWLLLTWPELGTWPAIQACTLTGNRTNDSFIQSLALNPQSHTNQGSICFHLFVSSPISFFSVLQFSEYRSFMSLVKFIPRCFVLLGFFDAVVNGIVFLVSLCVSSRLVYKNATGFWIFILYPATLLN